METGTGAGTESRAVAEKGTGTGTGNETRTGLIEGGLEAKKPKKPHKSCKRDVGNGGDLDGERRKHREESVGSVAAYPDNLENSIREGTKEQNTRGFGKILYK